MGWVKVQEEYNAGLLIKLNAAIYSSRAAISSTLRACAAFIRGRPLFEEIQ